MLERLEKNNNSSNENFTTTDEQQRSTTDQKAYDIISSGKIPDKVHEDVLKSLKVLLEDRTGSSRAAVGDFLKYSIPLYPLKEAITSEGDKKIMDVSFGITGLNMPVGLTMAFVESLNLIKEYRLMLSTRKEIHKREKSKVSLE